MSAFCKFSETHNRIIFIGLGKRKPYLCLPVLKHWTVRGRLNCWLSLPKYYSWRHLQGVSLNWSPSARLLEGLTDESTPRWPSALADGLLRPEAAKRRLTALNRYRNHHPLTMLPKNITESTRLHRDPVPSWDLIGNYFPKEPFFLAQLSPSDLYGRWLVWGQCYTVFHIETIILTDSGSVKMYC